MLRKSSSTSSWAKLTLVTALLVCFLLSIATRTAAYWAAPIGQQSHGKQAPEFGPQNREYYDDNGNSDNLKFVIGLMATAAVGFATMSSSSFTSKQATNNNDNVTEKKRRKVTTENVDVIQGFDIVKKRLGGMDLAFTGVHLTLTQKAKKNRDGTEQPATRVLLDGSFRGRARAGRMLAIMGPSGAGKSVLLHAIAGRIKADRKLTLRGERFIDGQIQSPDTILPAAFVEQEVNFFPRMTVRETLEFRVALHFGDLLDEESRDDLVNDLLEQLGLDICANTIVGDQKVRGISIGERKRLSIAVEMISSPRLVCCDEPTSSLDSAAAAVVIEKLRKLAVKGKTIICVIHQPSAMIFSQFDDVLLVSQGRQMYFGPVNRVRHYMELQGFLADEETGTAEHALDCVSPLPRLWESRNDAEERLKIFTRAGERQIGTLDIGIGHVDVTCPSLCRSVESNAVGPRTSTWMQFKLLFQRAIAENFRGKDVILIKTMQQVVVASIYGFIYTLGSNQASILDRFGLLSLTAIGGTNMAIATTLRAFPKEKTIASTEIAIKQYRALPYFVAKALSEFPLVFYYNMVLGTILYFGTGMNPGRFWTFVGLLTLHSLASEASGMAVGAVSPSSDVALAVFPAILILNIIFDGRNISMENTPFLLRWLPKVSLIRWGYEGLIVNEFKGLEFDTSDALGPAARNGEEALALFGMADASIEAVIHAEAIIMVVCWCLAYVGLTLTKQKFVVMTPRNAVALKKEA